MVSKPRSSEMHPGPGFRVKLDVVRPDPGLMEEFRNHATPDISDLLNRLYAMDPAIRLPHRRPSRALRPRLHRGRSSPATISWSTRRSTWRNRRHRRGGCGGFHPERRAGRPDLDQGATSGIAGFIVDGFDSRPALDPAARLPGLRPRDHPDRPPPPRAGGDQLPHLPAGGFVVKPGDLVVADAVRDHRHPRGNRAGAAGAAQPPRREQSGLPGVGAEGDFSNRWSTSFWRSTDARSSRQPAIMHLEKTTNGAGSRNGSRPNQRARHGPGGWAFDAGHSRKRDLA